MEDASKVDEELEEGECSDQDDSVMSNSDTVQQPMNYSSIGTNVYRREGIPQIIINSDQSDQDDSDDDDDDEFPSQGKKTCRYSAFDDPHAAPTTFVNPLRSQEYAESHSTGMYGKRRNNIWGAVMTEQILSQNIKQFGVNAPVHGGNRDVENYDFTKAKEDNRAEVDIKTDNTEEKEEVFGGVVDLEREVRKHQNRKRKRNVKERLGPRVGHNKRLGAINVTENDETSKIIQTITAALGEQNIKLFTRIIEAVGNEKALHLYNMTLDVENSGGMLINSGDRRRTPGGVYIQLLKSDSSISADVVSAVFEEETQLWLERKKELRQIKKAARKKWKKKKGKRLDMDLDRPETPTPTEELEELDNGNEVEVDVSDLPDRPDTPEPKDSSDNEFVEEDEDDDIAVAIAKARAAILKKQKEMAENKIQEDKNIEVNSENVEMT